jgi:hypothetical protein
MPQHLQGWVEQGNVRVATGGGIQSGPALASPLDVQQSFPGSTVTVYQAGTTTLATIYADKINTPKANPFFADATGSWNFYGPAGYYDVQFSGNGITTPYKLSDLIIPSTIPTFNVRDFGATGNGVTDDSAAVKAAFAAIPAAGGMVVFPGGVYNIVSPPIIVPSYTVVQGSSMHASKIHNAGTTELFHTVGLGDGPNVANMIVFQDIWIDGNASSGDGIYVYAPFGFYMNRCQVSGHGGSGIHTLKGGAGNLISQSVVIENSFIGTPAGGNSKGGVYFQAQTGDDAGNIFSIRNCSINGNGRFGVYAEKVVSLEIFHCEFAAYYYGAFLAGNQGVPLAVNGGENIVVASTSFENNGGNANVTPNYPIRFGYNGFTQANDTNNTQTAVVMDCTFAASPGQGNGALHDIFINYVTAVTIARNTYEKGTGYPHQVFAYEYGSLAANAKIQYFNNGYFPTLDGVEFNAGSTTYIALDDFQNQTTGGTNNNSIYVQTDAAGRKPFRVKFTGEAQDRFYIDGLGGVWVGPGGATAASQLFTLLSAGIAFPWGQVNFGQLGLSSVLQIFSNNNVGSGAFAQISMDNVNPGRLVFQAGLGSSATSNQVGLGANCVPISDNVYDLGEANLAWANFFTYLLRLSPRTFSQIGSPVGNVGSVRYITDSPVNTWGTAVTVGGGPNKVLVWANGTNWTVMGV